MASNGGNKTWVYALIPVMAAAGMAVAGWLWSNSAETRERVAKVEARAETNRISYDIMRQEIRENFTEIKTDLRALRDAIINDHRERRRNDRP